MASLQLSQWVKALLSGVTVKSVKSKSDKGQLDHSSRLGKKILTSTIRSINVSDSIPSISLTNCKLK